MLTHFLCFIIVNFIIIVIIFIIILPFNLLNSFKVKLSIINLAESKLEFREREFQTKRRERNISENSFSSDFQ